MAEHESEQLHGGGQLVAVSDAMVSIFREFSGKGPHRCKSYWAGADTLVVMLDGGYTAAEQTLLESGQGQEVMSSRHAFQIALEARMTEAVEGLTGRKVLAFMSASHQTPDLSAELFVLEPAGKEAATTPD